MAAFLAGKMKKERKREKRGLSSALATLPISDS